MDNFLFEIGIVVIFSAVFSVLSYFLRQPLILAYILAGVLIGPLGFGFVTDPEFIHVMAEIGVILMLFLIGLEMDVSRLKNLRKIALIAGLGQMFFTSLVGFEINLLLGFNYIESTYLAIALAFSSTVIAVKMLSDKHDTSSLYGQICIGILIVQDFLAVLALVFLASFDQGAFNFDPIHLFEILGEGFLIAVLTILFANKVLVHLYSYIANSREIIVIFSLAWCFLIAFISSYFGFSLEIGAFIAGISLANLPYTFEINMKAKVLRDFFITIFFASLGIVLVLDSWYEYIIPVVILSLFILIGNALIVIILMGLTGYDKRTSFFTGLTLANISEFSIIIFTLGHKIGHVDDKLVSMVIFIAVFTMIISTYLITYNRQLYNIFKKYLGIFARRKNKFVKNKIRSLSDHIVILGGGRVGSQILEQVMTFKESYIVVDHDNQVIENLLNRGVHCLFGDITDEDVLELLNLEKAEVIISTFPNEEEDYFLLRHLKTLKEKPIVIGIASNAREGLKLFEEGMDYVILKEYLSAQHIHQLNREIYDLEDNHLNLDGILSEEELKKLEKKPYEEGEYATFVHNINQKNLKNIKKNKKIKKK